MKTYFSLFFSTFLCRRCSCRQSEERWGRISEEGYEPACRKTDEHPSQWPLESLLHICSSPQFCKSAPVELVVSGRPGRC